MLQYVTLECAKEPVFSINQKWDESFIQQLKDKNVKRLTLGYTGGWKCDDYSFLERIPKLDDILIIDVPTESLKGIESQTELESLSLYIHIREKAGIDYTKFHRLKRLICDANKANESLYNCISLESLSIDGLKKGDSHHIGQLVNLRELEIKNSGLSDLTFLSSLHNLQKLVIANCSQISDFSPISSFNGLKWLALSGVRLNNLDFVKSMRSLDILSLSTGPVTSLRPIENLNLKAFWYSGARSRVIDNDMTPLSTLNNLSMLAINNHNEYNYKVNDHWDWNDYGHYSQQWLIPKKHK